MVSKDEVDKRITQVMDGLRGHSKLMFPNILPNTKKRFNALFDEAIDLLKDLASINESSPELLECEKNVYALEYKYHRLHNKLVVGPRLFLFYFGIILFFLLMSKVGISFLKEILQVKQPTKLISLGIAGAFLYLTIQLPTELRPLSEPKSKFASFVVRLLVAIVMPVVIVILFFTEEGQAKIKLTPELLSFACGYSAKLVIDILNKIVEKASDIIKAI